MRLPLSSFGAWRRVVPAAALMILSACTALNPERESAAQAHDQGTVDRTDEADAAPSTEPAFVVKVVSDDREIARHLEQHLELQRYARFPDLRAAEFRRLLTEADANARELLAALGYFNPTLALRVDDASEGGKAPRTIVVEVAPGPQTRVERSRIGFAEPMNSDPASATQRARIEQGWDLKAGAAFTEAGWDSAKTDGLRALQKKRYPRARIAESRATIDADAHAADLHVVYDPGPVYRFGSVHLSGVERYDANGIRNLIRLPIGAEYSEEELLDAQQRLSASGYFDSAFLALDPDEKDPEHATVIAQLREAKYQKVVFGVGVSTDAGLRLSLDHTHNKIPPLGWRAVSHVALDPKTQAVSTHWTAMPHASGWAWFLGAGLERAEVGDFKSNSLSLQTGRSKSVGHIDRRYYLQYDISKVEGSSAPGSSSSLMINYGWTGRYFDSKTLPTAGYGLGIELGAGLTLTPRREPFTRTRLRAMWFLPLGHRSDNGRRSRLALRGELGAVVTDGDIRVPSSLLFLNGGDTTVRGYAFQSIGTRSQAGKLYGGRYLTVGSVEWQRPIRLTENSKDWEHAIFVDVGSVSDDPDRMTLYTGVGTGLRWNSPVGPMQADVAYGVKTHQFRLHLRLGFSF